MYDKGVLIRDFHFARWHNAGQSQFGLDTDEIWFKTEITKGAEGEGFRGAVVEGWFRSTEL